MKTSSVSLTLLTAVLLAVPASAQDEMTGAGARPEGAGQMKKKHAELIRLYDKNGDGRLDEDEKAAAHKAMRKEGGGGGNDRRKQIIKRFDKDGDGQLNETERAAAEKFRAEQVKKFDADGDGQLNDAERETARQALLDGQPAGKRKKDK